MNFPKQLEKDFVPMATANPAEVSFKVAVNYKEFTPSLLPGELTTYSAWTGRDPLKVSAWGTYVFTGAESSNGLLWFFFAKPKTETEKKVPFRTSRKFEDKEWDTVLLDLAIVKESGIPVSTVAAEKHRKVLISGPKYGVRPVLIPGGARGTQFVIREYQAPSVFSIPAHETPVPMLVAYSIGEHQGNIVCLHEDLHVKSRRTVHSAVGLGVPHGVIAGQFFPATNMTTWEDHVVSDDQNFVNGVWHRVQVEAIAPELEDPISTN